MHANLQNLGILAVVVLFAACTSPPPAHVMTTQGSTLVQTAQVTDVRDVTVRGGRPSGVGSFVGAILGSVAGSRIGSGNGSAAAGIGGALAGGMAGQRVEESGMGSSATELTVRMENGDVRTYRVDRAEFFRIGDTVTLTTANGITRVTHQ
jgi:outer membrane lipoprotein SlyB